MDHEPTSSYGPLRRRGRWWRRWHTLRWRVRLLPRWPWWAIWIGGATVVAVLLHLGDLAPWWLGPPVGLLLGLGVLGLTTLDDVRRPVASLRVLAAALREDQPLTSFAVRAEAFDIPLYAPAPGGADDIGLTGGGASYGPRLLSPARPRLRVSWSDLNSDRAGETSSTTVAEPSDPRNSRWLYHGQVSDTHPDEDLDEPAEFRIDEEEVRRQDATMTVVLDGTAHEARAADLRPWGAGWAATLRLDDRFGLDLCGRGELPHRLELVRWDPTDLAPHSTHSTGRDSRGHS